MFRRRVRWRIRLSLDEAAAVLSERTRSYSVFASLSAWWHGEGPRHWMGTAGPSGFELEPVRRSSNAFRPVARGHLEARGPHAGVEVEFTPRLFARLFTLLPLGMGVLGTVFARDPAALGLAFGTALFWLVGQLLFRFELGDVEAQLRADLPEDVELLSRGAYRDAALD